MLKSLIQHLKCEICGHELIYDPKVTFEIYTNELEITIDSVELKIDEIVGEFLVYECPKCKCIYKYTYKEIEKIIRRGITKQVLLVFARGQMNNVSDIMNGVLIYCGKCSGFDGNGSCTKKIYDKCKIKRFPNVV